MRTTSGSGAKPIFELWWYACDAIAGGDRGRFWFHYSLLGLITLAITLACIFSFAFNKLHVPLKGFGEGEFKSATVISQAIATFDFFVCQCNV